LTPAQAGYILGEMSWIVTALDEWADVAKVEEGLSGSASRVRVDGATDPVKALVRRRWRAGPSGRCS